MLLRPIPGTWGGGAPITRDVNPASEEGIIDVSGNSSKRGEGAFPGNHSEKERGQVLTVTQLEEEIILTQEKGQGTIWSKVKYWGIHSLRRDLSKDNPVGKKSKNLQNFFLQEGFETISLNHGGKGDRSCGT